MSNLSVMFSSQTDEWATPQEFFDKLNKEFHFTLDPCALPSNAKCKRYFTPADNGLLQNWGGKLCSVIRRMVVLFMIGCVNAVRRRKNQTLRLSLSYQREPIQNTFTSLSIIKQRKFAL